MALSHCIAEETWPSLRLFTSLEPLREGTHKEHGHRQTHKISRLVVPLRSGNSLMSVAPFRDLERNKDKLRDKVGDVARAAESSKASCWSF